MKYKLRAECLPDVLAFFEEAMPHISNLSIEDDIDFPDVQLEFETELELEDIITLLRNIEDGHVMYQTVQPIEKYTGERNYDL